MESKLEESQAKLKKLPPAWIRALIVSILLLSVFFRFTNLGQKVYWNDEVYTSLWVGGHSRAEVVQTIANNDVINPEELQKFQQIYPGRGVVDTVQRLATEDAQHPPLYYIITRIAAQWFGLSPEVTRGVSALFSLLTFPLVYWLCLELFESALVGAIAVILIAISPLHILYAQEAREYGLWTVTTLFSNVALLRAMRNKTKRSWGIYAVSVSLGLYSFLFGLLVTFSQGLYVFLIERFKPSKTLASYLTASLVGVLLFLPWMLVVHQNQISAAGWTSRRMEFLAFAKNWLLNLNRIFFDVDFNSNSLFLLPILPILLLIVYSIYFICRHAPTRVWLFILTSVGGILLVLTVPDLLLGGRRSIVPRYLLPSYLSIQLAVAYLFSVKLTVLLSKELVRKVWQVALAILISVEIFSCAASASATSWWNKYDAEDNLPVVDIVSQSSRPLVIAESFAGAISLSYLLEPSVSFRLLTEQDVLPNLARLANEFTDVFLLNVSSDLKQEIEATQGYELETVYRGRFHHLLQIDSPG
jgi:uncharacterized membrane protein